MSERTDLKIFIASSGELQSERDESSKVIIELNKNYPNLHLEPVLFELDTASGNNPGLKRIQDKINPLLDNCEVVIVLFYSKVGEFTAEEFLIAKVANKKIFLYLKEGFQPKHASESNQYTKVLELKEVVEKESEIRYQNFKTLNEYNGLFSKDLNKYLSENYSTSKNSNTMDIPPFVTINRNNLDLFPHPKPYFTGRNNEIKDFKDAIDKKITFIAIDGPGGIGKTQLVSQCIHQFIPKEKILWCECTSASQLDTIISEAGYPELLIGSSKTDREKFSAFKDKIQENELFLFLDNFQETNGTPVFKEFLKFINEYLQKGCVIVIDRDDIRDIHLTPKRIHISGFKENRLEYVKALINHSFKEIEISDSELEKLCDQLQGYPLAIDFAILLLSEGVTISDIITKIVQEGEGEQINERLLNAIFNRPDASEEEKELIKQFSVFTGPVSKQAVFAIIPEPKVEMASRRLQKKNLLTYSNETFVIHPLVREICYKKLEDKETVHAKAAGFYIQQRTNELSPVLEEQIFYHLAQSRQWNQIEREIEEKGRKFILSGQIGLLKELLNKLKAIGIEKPIFDILFGDIAEIQGRWQEAQEYFNHARLNNEDKEIKAEGIVKYGEILFRKGLLKQAETIYIEAYEYCCFNNFQKQKSRALNDLGLLDLSFGNLDSAYERINDALKIRININDKEGIATSLLNISILHEKKGELDKALNIVKEASKIRKEIGDISGIAHLLNHEGNILINKGKFTEAVQKFKESFTIYEKVGNVLGVAVAKSGIGNALCKQEKNDEAMNIYGNCLEIFTELGNRASIASMYHNIGLIMQNQKKFDEAIRNYEESLKIAEELGDKLSLAETYYNIGTLYAANKITDRALVYLFKAYSIQNFIGAKSKLRLPLSWIVNIRDKGEIRLEIFKNIAENVYKEMSSEMQKYIPLNEFLKEPTHRQEIKVGRNDPCYCGSGKKYKSCHGLGN